MVVSLHDIPKESLVYHFITNGKPGFCSFLHKGRRFFADKLEEHHLCYSPEITIKLCHNCHHKVHFWPQRLSDEEITILLTKRFNAAAAQKIKEINALGISALSRAIAPSRQAFIHAVQKLD